VISNSGARTPGVDGILWNTPEAKSTAFQALRRHGYRPQPLRRVYIPKSNGRRRALGIPTMTDRAMQALYLADYRRGSNLPIRHSVLSDEPFDFPGC
jgi:RNA-directed DNA polymerase